MPEILVILAFIALGVIIIAPIVAIVKISSLMAEVMTIARRLGHIEKKLAQTTKTDKFQPTDWQKKPITPAPTLMPTSRQEARFKLPHDLPESAVPPLSGQKQPTPEPVDTTTEKPLKEAETSSTSIQDSPTPAVESKDDSPPAPYRSIPRLETKPARQPNRFETEARAILRKIWNWIVVGEEFRDPKVSMEYAMASNWLLRIGIICTVVGIGYFLKYSIDHGWLNESARTAMTLLTGALMLGGGTRLLTGRYRLMGQGLMGGGVVTLYFGIFAGYALFNGLIPLIPAFVAMVLITLTSCVLANHYNALLVALLGIMGGFATPIMLSTGRVNFPGLFSYMLILILGVCYISTRRRWYLLNNLSLVATWGISLAALSDGYREHHFWQVLPFLTAFYIVYSLIAYLYIVIKDARSNLLEILAILANTAVYFGTAYALVEAAHGRSWTSLLALALGAFSVIQVRVMLLRHKKDRELMICFIGLAAFFLSITVPLLFTGQWITVCWAVQALVMLWIALRIDSRFLRHVSLLLYVLMLGRLSTGDLPRHFGAPLDSGLSFSDYLPMLLDHLLTTGAAVLSMLGAWQLLRREPVKTLHSVESESDTGEWIRASWAKLCLFAIGSLLLFVFLQLEAARLCRVIWDPMGLPVLTALWVTACFLLAKASIRPAYHWLRVPLTMGLVGIFFKLIMIDLAHWHLYDSFGRSLCYERPYSPISALMRLADFGLIIALLIHLWQSQRSRLAEKQTRNFFGAASLILFFAWSTLELNTCLYHFVPELRSGAISILWTIFALSTVSGGILRNIKALRYTGLVLFAVVAVKVFAVDLARLGPLWRIVAFMAMGILILAGSFMYLRFQQTFAKDPSDDQKNDKS